MRLRGDAMVLKLASELKLHVSVQRTVGLRAPRRYRFSLEPQRFHDSEGLATCYGTPEALRWLKEYQAWWRARGVGEGKPLYGDRDVLLGLLRDIILGAEEFKLEPGEQWGYMLEPIEVAKRVLGGIWEVNSDEGE